MTATMMGTAAISRPLSELDSLVSASVSSSQGTMISTRAKTASQRQCGRSTASSCRRIASGSKIRAPMLTRASTSTGGATPPTATLISRYGTPQIRPIAANNHQPRRLNFAPTLGVALELSISAPAGWRLERSCARVC
jgi:hypothetical protein